jgi:hypothetical protein
MIALLYGTGLRGSELLDLQASSVDFAAGAAAGREGPQGTVVPLERRDVSRFADVRQPCSRTNHHPRSPRLKCLKKGDPLFVQDVRTNHGRGRPQRHSKDAVFAFPPPPLRRPPPGPRRRSAGGSGDARTRDHQDHRGIHSSLIPFRELGQRRLNLRTFTVPRPGRRTVKRGNGPPRFQHSTFAVLTRLAPPSIPSLPAAN